MNSDRLHYSNFSNFESHLYDFKMAKNNTSISPEVKNAYITSLRKTFVRWCTELVLENEFHEFEKTFNEWVKYDVEIVNDLTIVDLFWGIIKPEQATSSSETMMQIDDNMESDVEMADRSRITGMLWGSIKSEEATSSSETSMQIDVKIADDSGVSEYFTMTTEDYDSAFFEKFLTENAEKRSIIHKMRDIFISWCKRQLAKGQDEEMERMLDTWIKYDPMIEKDHRVISMWGM